MMQDTSRLKSFLSTLSHSKLLVVTLGWRRRSCLHVRSCSSCACAPGDAQLHMQLAACTCYKQERVVAPWP